MTVRASTDGWLVGFRVSPSARVTRVQGVYGNRLKVQVSAPPEDDRANAELAAALARWVGLPRGCVSVHAGHRKRDKIVAFTGIDERMLLERLESLADCAGRAE
ncbi:MAG: DUF167 family protein [Thermoleophilia bacterium]|nr:DUF167 family protein [Thermoleophilia bacterium]